MQKFLLNHFGYLVFIEGLTERRGITFAGHLVGPEKSLKHNKIYEIVKIMNFIGFIKSLLEAYAKFLETETDI